LAKQAIISFNAGELTPKLDARFDVSNFQNGCIVLQNMFPTKYGGAERRPGTKFIDSSYDDNTIVRLFPFIYSSDVVYKIEAVDGAFRFFYGDSVLLDSDSAEVVIDTPFEEADLFQLQYYQIGDVMWIVNDGYAQQKLSRTSAESFELNEIEFTNGPFLTRNDLLDPDNPSTTTLACSATEAGSYGTLTSTVSVFLPEHEDALFKLIHPREETIVEAAGTTPSDAMDVKGTFSFVTHGKWTGTVYLQRKEHAAAWENFRTYKGNGDRNIQLSHTEDSNNVQYRVKVADSPVMSSAFRGEITVETSTQEGIVKIVGVGDSYNAVVKVLKTLASTDATSRWAEGAWSGVRGWPSSITFFEDRCVYGGATTGSVGDANQIKDYPNLLNLTF